VSLLAITFLAAVPKCLAAVPSPEEFLGHKVGEDRYLAPYPKVLEYLRTVAAGSDRVSVETAGRSTLDNEMMVVVITSAANQQKLGRYREIAAKLADPAGLGEDEADALVREGKAIVLVTCSIHSTEVGSTQMAMELAWQMATATDPATLRWLDDVILLVMPSINPDGQVMVVDWYDKYLGTQYEGGQMPWLYHHFVGHDDNRDYYMLTQKETRVVNDVLYHRWFPQVFLDEHQMGEVGPRMFVPPQADPLAPEVHSLIFRQADILGTGMALRLEEAGKRGVGSNMIFDSYWPGGTRNTAWWKNVTGLLTEVASARIATPVLVEHGELRGGMKGLPEYTRRANFPSPWEGGWWRLRDIVDYELIATKALVEGCSIHREELLRNFRAMGLESVEKGRTEPPYAFVIPPEQHDPVAAARLVELLLRHAVKVDRAGETIEGGLERIPAGSYVIPAAQSYRAFLLTMLRPQRYPEVLASVGGKIFEPYDVASWSLPLSMGVEVRPEEQPVEGRLDPVSEPDWPGGDPGEAPGGYAIPHSADSAFSAVNRLLKEGHEVYFLEDGGAAGPGAVWVPPGEIPRGAMTDLSRDLHVPVQGLGSAPHGAAWKVKAPRIGLYKPWVASMDEGWTRFILEQYGFDYVSLDNQAIRSGEFASKVDVLVLPDIDASIIKSGKPPKESRRPYVPLPPEYAGGLEDDGGARIRKWVEDQGGVVVALNDSAQYVIDLMDLPVRNVLDKVKKDDFNCPGSMLRMIVDDATPLGFGTRRDEAAFFGDSPAFDTRPPDGRFTRRVVARWPDDGKDVLLSGYIKGATTRRVNRPSGGLVSKAGESPKKAASSRRMP
ncbi:MAG TPA: M14 metallopeptidase family protein, partial [Candidatus Saccharimonadales bacterium]|nr:M14 metallopeptidase family protein [Candidatus Saccharimonadales bacterium]